MEENTERFDECAICQKRIPSEKIEEHVNQCFENQSKKLQSSSTNKRKSYEKAFDIFNVSTKKLKIESNKNEELKKLQEKTPDQPSSSTENSTKTKIQQNISPPLADLMRPTDFSDYYGQDTAIGKNSIIRNLLKNNMVTSAIFWGSPGCGKTTLAHIIYNHCNQHKEMFRFVKMSACTCGVNEVKEAIKQAKSYRDTFKKQTILFMDEIHRFNKLQQDTFLPFIENGTHIFSD